MTEKRFEVWKTIGSFSCWHIEDIIEDKVVVDNIMYKYEADRLCKKMNDLHKENQAYLKEIRRLENREKQLTNEIQDFQELLTQQQKPFLKIIDDYFIKYGDDSELFSMHKPSDIRSLMHILNREHGYNELQCEYNDKDMK